MNRPMTVFLRHPGLANRVDWIPHFGSFYIFDSTFYGTPFFHWGLYKDYEDRPNYHIPNNGDNLDRLMLDMPEASCVRNYGKQNLRI